MSGESLEDQSLIAVLTPLVEHPDAKGRILRIERRRIGSVGWVSPAVYRKNALFRELWMVVAQRLD